MHAHVFLCPFESTLDFFFRDQRQAILMEMESKAALFAAKENDKALARARQEYDDDEDDDGHLRDAIVVDLEDSDCSTDSIRHSKKQSHSRRKRRRSETKHRNDDDDEVIEIEAVVQPKKISFRELGIEIGRRWKDLQELGESSQQLIRYRELADTDAARYKAEMDEYHRQKVSAMCRGGNLGHRYNEARQTVEAKQALQAQEAVTAMKAAMENHHHHHQQQATMVLQNQAQASAPQVQPQDQPQVQAQAQAQAAPNVFPGGMMPVMMMMPSPLNPSQMMLCMMMMPVPAGTANVAMPMHMPMNMPGGMVMQSTPGTERAEPRPQQHAQHEAKAQPPPLPEIQQANQQAQQQTMPQSLPPAAPLQQPPRKGFFPSIGPSLEILEDFDEFPIVDDPSMPDFLAPFSPPLTTTDVGNFADQFQQPSEELPAMAKNPKKACQDDLLGMSFDDAALLAVSKDNDAFNKFLHSLVDAATTTKKKKLDDVPTKIVNVHKHHSHHPRKRQHYHLPQSDHRKRTRRASNTSVDTTSLVKDIAKAFGEDWDPTPVKMPKNISFQTKILKHSSKASTLAAAAPGRFLKNPKESNSTPNNVTVYRNFDKTMDSLETYNYESDVSGFHDLFECAEKEDEGMGKGNKPFFPAIDLSEQNEPIFDSAKRSGAEAGPLASTNGGDNARPFFPCVDTKAAVENGFLNNNVTTDITTFNKMALFHGRSNVDCSLDSADRAAGVTNGKLTTSEKVVDLTADNVIGNLQELLQRQQEILGMKI